MKTQKKHKAPGYADLLLDTLKVIASRGGAASIVCQRRLWTDGWKEAA